MSSRLERTRWACILSSVLLAATTTQAAPGDLDPTLAGTGKLRAGVGGGNGEANAVVRQSDGKLVVAGEPRFALVRYNANGSLDSSFGTGGRVQTPIGTSGEADSMVLLSGNKLLVAGLTSNGGAGYLSVAKYNTNGSLDNSFGGGDGITEFPLSSDFGSCAMAVQADGKIVVVVNLQIANSAITLVRFNGDGSPDTTFDGNQSGNGMVTTNIPGFTEANGRAIGLQGSKIVVAGSATSGSSVFVVLLRYNANGTLDDPSDGDGITFGTNGIVTTGTNGTISVANSLAFFAASAGEDRIVVGGHFENAPPDLGRRIALWSYNAIDGSPDTTFGSAGRVITDVANSSVSAVRVQLSLGVSSRIVAAGSGGGGFFAARYLLSGSPDNAFDGDGVALTKFRELPSTSAHLGNAMLIQPGDNKVVVAGKAGSYIGVLRYNANGSLDASFDGDGERVEDFGDGNSAARSVMVRGDGRIVAAGGSAIARFHPDGSFDTAFGRNGDGKVLHAAFPIRGAALQADGKIVVVGEGGHFFNAARYNENGSLDTAFGSGGFTSFDLMMSTALARAVVVQPDGAIVIGGSVYTGQNYRFALVRLLSNGQPDSSFGNAALTTTAADTTSECIALTLQGDGKIVAAGYSDPAPTTIGNESFAVVRYQTNGAPDSGFGMNGVAKTPGTLAQALAVAMQSDKILIGGMTSDNGNADFALLRYNSNGGPDNTFDGDGKVVTPVSAFSDLIWSLAVQADGKIIAAGWADTGTTNPAYDFAVARYHSNGSFDMSYGNGGKVVFDFLNGGEDRAYSVTLDAEGRAVVAGEAAGRFGIARLQGDAPLPTPSPTPTATPMPTPTPTPTPTPAPGLVGNVSTRLPVRQGDDVLIQGFIVLGPDGSTKKIMVRALGPFLAQFGITDALANPTLELRDGSNAVVATNNDWRTTQVGGIIPADQSAEIESSGLAPAENLESAIIAELTPGNYTAVVRGLGDTIGTGIVDAYDMSAASPARLANISTRGLIQPGDQLMIAGVIIQNGDVRAAVRAIGPSLSQFGITNALPDTTLQLRDVNGAVVMENDDWQTDSQQKQELEAIGLQPGNPGEAAFVTSITPGQYTIQVRGKPETTGIGVVEVYFLQ